MRKEKPAARNYKSFLIIFDYVSLNGEEDSPVMAICGVKSKRSYIIPLSNAFYFADSVTGGPTGELVEMSAGIAERIGLIVDKYNTRKIMDAIVENLPSLIEMPPKKPMTREQFDKKAEQHGVVVSIDGHKLLDAS